MDGRWIWKFRNICGRASLCGIVCLVSALSTTTTTTTTTNTKTPTTTPTVRVSIGEQIQQSTNIPELLQVANDFWLPTDDNLPLHLQTQRIHHEKRLRWSSQLLHKMGDRACCCRSDDVDVPWQESGFSRAILAASIPFQDDRPEKEGRYLREALVGLHNMFGYIAPTEKTSLPDPVKQAILQLVKRANNLAFDISLPEAAEIRWACLGIFARSNALDDNFDEKSILISQLEERVAALPFDLVPKVIDWDEVFPDETATRRLQEEIPFHFDTIVTRTGAAVTERRGTAWIAEDGIGALAYSGKLMSPHEISDPIRTIMRLVEDRVIQNRNFPRPFFDCALCNHYPDGESACKFHTDPEHGSKWERLNCVIAAGSPRRFAFRPIPGHATWSDYESNTGAVTGNAVTTTKTTAACDPNVPAVITLFPGDVAKMWGTCNDDFHHAVYPGQARPGEREVSRISLVLKRAIPNSSGLRGHRLSGEGRRSRRRVQGEEKTSPSLPRDGPTGRKKRRRNDSRRR